MKLEMIILDLGIFLKEHSSRRKIPRSKKINDKFTQTEKIDGAKLFLSIISAISDIFNAFYV